jgi:hypothetical protein
VLEKLARRFTRTDERELSEIVASLPQQPDSGFLRDLERRLHAMQSGDSGPTKISEVGLLLLVPRI